MEATTVGSTGSGPIVDSEGKPLRGLNHLSPQPEGDQGPDDGEGSSRPRRRPALRGTKRVLFALAGVLVPALIVLGWHLATTRGLVPAHQLPSPGAVVSAGIDLWQRGQFQVHIAISTQRVLSGFAIGSLLGLVLGSAVGLSRWFAAAFSPTIGAIRAVPSLAWVPLLILWIGINEDSKITLITIGAFFPVFTTVAGALRHVDPHLVEAGRAYGLRGLRLLRTVQLPAVVPSVVSGLRLALAQAWLFVVAAELIASSMGLGFLIIDSANNGRIDRMLLAIVSFAVLGKLTDTLIGVGEKYLLKRWT